MVNEEEKKTAQAGGGEEVDTTKTSAEAEPEVTSETSAEDAQEETKEEAQSEETASVKEDRETAALLEKVAALQDRAKRQLAEFDNFRKRTDKEKEQMFSMGERSVIEKILPVVDNFERGLQTVPESEKENPLASGMEMIYKQLVKQLEDLGVTPIEAIGKEFDQNFFNAVMQVESEEFESGVVAQEFQKGYMYHDTVLRHSMVAVAK